MRKMERTKIKTSTAKNIGAPRNESSLTTALYASTCVIAAWAGLLTQGIFAGLPTLKQWPSIGKNRRPITVAHQFVIFTRFPFHSR